MWHRWNDFTGGPSELQQMTTGARCVPPQHRLTTLGWLKHNNAPGWTYWEHYYLKFLHKSLTTNWRLIMYGADARAERLWWEIFQVLELDRKSQLDLLMLAQSGQVGRAYANKILWDLLSDWALEGEYRDLSNKVSSDVGWARRNFDRPPRTSWDLEWWAWAAYQVPREGMVPWDPTSLPPQRWDLRLGPGGEPLPPPECWGPVQQ